MDSGNINSKSAKALDDGYIFIDIAEVWQCVYCGAYAKLKEEIAHYNSCNPEESERFLYEHTADDKHFGRVK